VRDGLSANIAFQPKLARVMIKFAGVCKAVVVVSPVCPGTAMPADLSASQSTLDCFLRATRPQVDLECTRAKAHVASGSTGTSSHSVECSEHARSLW
jgi:hypothetical protein